MLSKLDNRAFFRPAGSRGIERIESDLSTEELIKRMRAQNALLADETSHRNHSLMCTYQAIFDKDGIHWVAPPPDHPGVSARGSFKASISQDVENHFASDSD